MPKHSLGEEPYPNIQPKPPQTQLQVIQEAESCYLTNKNYTKDKKQSESCAVAFSAFLSIFHKIMYNIIFRGLEEGEIHFTLSQCSSLTPTRAQVSFSNGSPEKGLTSSSSGTTATQCPEPQIASCTTAR